MPFNTGLFVDECLATFNFYTFVTASFIALEAGATGSAKVGNAFYALFIVGIAATIANGVRPNAHFNPIRSIAKLFLGADLLECAVVRPLGQFLGAFLGGWVVYFLFDKETGFAGNTKPQGLDDAAGFLLEAFVSCTIVYFLADEDNNNDKGNFKVYGLTALLTYNYTNSSGNFIRSAVSSIFQIIRAEEGQTIDVSPLWFLIGAGVTGAVIAGIFSKFIESYIPTDEKKGSQAADQNAIALSQQGNP